MDYTKHTSVLLDESLNFLLEAVENIGDKIEEEIYFADLTFGGGGHSFTLLERNPLAKLIAFDQDPDAIRNGEREIKSRGLEGRIKLFHANYEKFVEIVEAHCPHIKGFLGILMDLGVSSHHLDAGRRGFSFHAEAELDMRMNYSDSEQITAKDIIRAYTENELIDIFQKYGEEKFSKRIARAIVEHRKTALIEKTSDLENIIFHCYPKNLRHKRQNPSTKVFQALRIEVNRELEVLENNLEKIAKKLLMGGRLAVISFHSTEDRIVKHKFKEISENKAFKILTKKPIIPSEAEISTNKRSRSAKMRVLERIH